MWIGLERIGCKISSIEFHRGHRRRTRGASIAPGSATWNLSAWRYIDLSAAIEKIDIVNTATLYSLSFLKTAQQHKLTQWSEKMKVPLLRERHWTYCKIERCHSLKQAHKWKTRRDSVSPFSISFSVIERNQLIFSQYPNKEWMARINTFNFPRTRRSRRWSFVS